jgi:ribosome-associated toxin RatA of RatAB toxin-antitoxin module
MPRVESSIVIAADVETVYGTAKEVERFPEFMPDVKSVRVLERSEEGRRTVVEWVGLIPEFKTTIKWIEEDQWNDAAHSCDFRLVRGDFKSYSGRWEFTPTPDGTCFTSLVDYEYDIPLIGPLIKALILKKMRENVDRLQAALKEHIERR